MSEKEYHTAEFCITYSVPQQNKNNTHFFILFYFFPLWSAEDVSQF